MTAKQEAIELIEAIPEEELVFICGYLRRYSNKSKQPLAPKKVDFSKYRILTERGKDPDGYVRSLRENDRF